MLQKENDTNYWFEFFYAWAVIVMLQSAKTTLLVWHYFWWEEIRSDNFWTTLYCNNQLRNNYFWRKIHIVMK